MNRIFPLFLTLFFILNCKNENRTQREYLLKETNFNFQKIIAKDINEIENENAGIQMRKPFKVTLSESYFPEIEKYEFEQPIIYWRDSSNIKNTVSYFFTKKDSLVRVIEYAWSKPKDNDSIILKIYEENLKIISKKLNQKGKVKNEHNNNWKQQIISWENDSIYVWSFIFSNKLPRRTRVIIRQKL